MFNALATGQKVYGQGSYVPTRGQVSAQGAQGYLQREINNNLGNRNLFGGVSQVGPDGQSDTRSGVAATALRRRMAGPMRDKDDGRRPVGNKNNKKKKGGGISPPLPVKINKDGVLELPYNQEISMGILQAQNDLNSQLMELNTQQQGQALEHAQGIRQTNLDYGDLQRATLNDNAGRGTIFSSGYGAAIGRNAQAFNNQMNDLVSQNALFNNDVDRQRLGIESAFNNLLSQYYLDHVNKAAEDAGNLGFGRNIQNRRDNLRNDRNRFNRRRGRRQLRLNQRQDTQRLRAQELNQRAAELRRRERALRNNEKGGK